MCIYVISLVSTFCRNGMKSMKSIRLYTELQALLQSDLFMMKENPVIHTECGSRYWAMNTIKMCRSTVKDNFLNIYLLSMISCTLWSRVSVDARILRLSMAKCLDPQREGALDQTNRPPFALITLLLTRGGFWGVLTITSISVLLC